MTADEAAVLAANDLFYRAFAARDLRALDRLWARRADVVCIHPGWQAVRGREAVMKSWRDILSNPGSPAIACVRPTAYLLGDAAFVVCTERLPGGELVATNIFTREDGEWRMVQHHAGDVAVPSREPDPSETRH
jgi:ketosteroid isomerase-like protein